MARGKRVRLQSRVLTLLLSPSDLDGMFPSLSTFAGALRTRQWLRKDPEAEVDPAFGRPFQLSLSTQPSLTSLCYNRTTHAPTLDRAHGFRPEKRAMRWQSDGVPREMSYSDAKVSIVKLGLGTARQKMDEGQIPTFASYVYM